MFRNLALIQSSSARAMCHTNQSIVFDSSVGRHDNSSSLSPSNALFNFSKALAQSSESIAIRNGCIRGSTTHPTRASCLAQILDLTEMLRFLAQQPTQNPTASPAAKVRMLDNP